MNRTDQNLVRRNNGKIHDVACSHRPAIIGPVVGTKGMTIREVVAKYGKDLCSYCFPASVVERATEETQVETETQETAQQAPDLDTSGVLAADDVAQVVDNLRDRGLIHGAVVGASPVTGETIAQVADVTGRSWVLETGPFGVWTDRNGPLAGHVTPCETVWGAGLALAWAINADRELTPAG